jgi:adenylosuccinate synthase
VSGLPRLFLKILLNGVTQIIITKLDVLNTFDEVLVPSEWTKNDGNAF